MIDMPTMINRKRSPLIVFLLGLALLVTSGGRAQAQAEIGAATTYELSQGLVPLGEAGVAVARTEDGGYHSRSYVNLEGLLSLTDDLVTRPDGSVVSYAMEGSAQGVEVTVDATFVSTGVVLDIVQAGNATSFELTTEGPLYVVDNNFLDGYQILVNALLAGGQERLEGTVLVPQAAALGHLAMRATGEGKYVFSDDQRVWAVGFELTMTVRNQEIEAQLWVDESGEIALLEQTLGAVRFERRSAGAVAEAPPASVQGEPRLQTAREMLDTTAECVEVTKVEVASSGEVLQGLLSLPGGARDARGAPTLLLLPGSGAVDLRGNSPPYIVNAGYEQLANALGCHGFGVLRVAKLGLPPSTGDANAVTLDTYATNAADWLALLAEAPGVDPRRLGVIGHSEGGLVALYAAAAGFIEPATLVLLATPGRPLDVLLKEQLLASARRGGANEATIEQLSTQVDEVIEAVDESTGPSLELTGELAVNPVAQLFAHAAGLLRSEFAQDPAELMAAVAAPTVIFQGGKDLQVLPLDGEALAAAAPGALYLLLPDMSHNLVDIVGPATSGLVPSSDAVVSSTLVEALATFLNGSLRLLH